MPSVFISYRRADSQGEAGRLFDDLSVRFQPESVFIDVATLEAGRDFRTAIHTCISTCSVLLALIGQQWTDLRNSRGARRLDDPNDIVRAEIAFALRRDIPVIPVLVQGAKMPEAEQLPEELKDLSYRNAAELTHARWKSDVQVLIQALAPYLDRRESQPVGKFKEGFTGFGAASSARSANLSDTGTALEIEAATIERVGRELATYIGPISAVVVQRVAKRCSGVDELYSRAAQEIEKEVDRARFLSTCGR